MKTVVVGGHSRNIGKTSVVAGIVAGLGDRRWVAVKITQYGHGICSRSNQPCACSIEDPDCPYAISEEQDRSGRSDSSRFLAAGAQRSLWVRTRIGRLGLAMPALRQALAGEQNVIIESNSVLGFLQPDLYLVVLDPVVADFKESARSFLDRGDAFILVENPRSKVQSPKSKAGKALISSTLDIGHWTLDSLDKPVFRARRGEYITPEVLAFVAQHLPN